MPVYEFELFHGAVLTKVCRNDRPIALTLIETRDGSRAAYWLNDTILYIKHSTSPQTRGNTTRWGFTFSPDHLADLREYAQKREVYLALVCGRSELADTMEICLIWPDEIGKCIDLSSTDTQWMAVEVEPRRRLRAYGPLNNDDEDKLIIPRRRLDDWQVPGR